MIYVVAIGNKSTSRIAWSGGRLNLSICEKAEKYTPRVFVCYFKVKLMTLMIYHLSAYHTGLFKRLITFNYFILNDVWKKYIILIYFDFKVYPNKSNTKTVFSFHILNVAPSLRFGTYHILVCISDESEGTRATVAVGGGIADFRLVGGRLSIFWGFLEIKKDLNFIYFQKEIWQKMIVFVFWIFF